MNSDDIRSAMQEAGGRSRTSDIIQPHETLKVILMFLSECPEAREDAQGICSLTGVNKEALRMRIQEAMNSMAQLQQQQNRNQSLINNLR